MIEKKDKEAGYIELEQPEGVPDVKSIMEKELNQKLRKAHVEPQQVDPIGGNTIPPCYSREVSRYEPPIPVQEKEKQEALEKVKEITNGGSKGSKSEKPVEGVLTYHGIMRVWNPIQSLVNSNPLGIPDHHDERDCTKFIFKKEKQGSVSPQPIKSNPQVGRSETKVKEKWNPMERNNNVDKDTESGWKNKIHSLKRKGKNKVMRSLLGLILRCL